MIRHFLIRTFALLALGSAAGFGASDKETLDSFLHRNEVTGRETDQRMEVEIQASLPKLQKHGTMKGLKVISQSGQVAYRFVRFTGDKLVKTDVIVRFLTADAKPQARPGDVAITLRNYRFHFLKTADYHGTTAFVYQLTPRKKRVGLYRGELWLDASTGAPLLEAGELVKSPSIFVRRVRFVRQYAENNPQLAAWGQPERVSINVQTRVVGDADLTVLQRPADDSAGDSADDSVVQPAGAGDPPRGILTSSN